MSPVCSLMLLIDQLLVPVAVPEPPRLLFQTTFVTPTSSLATPASVSSAALVLYVLPLVGAVMLMSGRARSVMAIACEA